MSKPGRPGARKSTKKGATKGSGGQGRKSLEGKGPTPKAEDRTYHPAYKRKPKPGVRWSVGGKTFMGDGFSPDGDAFFVLSPADGDNAGVSDPAKLFTDGDWTFETSKGFEDSWGDYTIPFAFLSGIIVDIGTSLGYSHPARPAQPN